jgi:hypothetical protein
MPKLLPFKTKKTFAFSLLFALLMATALSSAAQTAKQIIDKHIIAIGGKAKLDAITTYSFAIGDNMITYKKPGKWNVAYRDSGKMVKTEIYYGDKGWETWKDGRTGITTFGVEFAYFIPGLLSYAAAPDYKVESLGTDTESDNLRIKITSLVHNTMQTSFTFYINPSTYMITKVKEDNSSISYNILLENYKTINGIQIPMTIRKKSDYSESYYPTTRTNVKLNIPVDDKLFARPVLKKELSAFRGTNEKYGYHDEMYTTIIKPLYDNAWGFQDDPIAKVELNKLFGYIDKTGKVVIPVKYVELESFNAGLAAFMVDKKWGYMDVTGKAVIAANFDKVSNFKQGLAAVMMDKKWGYIDPAGNLIVPVKYDQANYFQYGRAIVKLDKKWGCIDEKGNEVIPAIYESVGYFKDGKTLVKKDGEQFYLDLNGKKVL